MANSPLMNGFKRSQHGSHGRLAEEKAARRLGARLTPASGACDGAKGDMSTEDMLIENKATKNASMSLKLEWLQKIAHEAQGRGKQPALALQFVSENGNPRPDGAWVCIPEWVYNELIAQRETHGLPEETGG